jgi:hypothetical protein
MFCLFCVVPSIICVYMCTEQLPPVGYPVAVKYISNIIYKIIHQVYKLCDSSHITDIRIVSVEFREF